MIDIPLNKALAAAEGDVCGDCVFTKDFPDCKYLFACDLNSRKDGKNVIFKLVDLPEENSNE